MSDFETRVHAKCILSGEHTVLRGGQAIVCPLQQFHTTLVYHPAPTALVVRMDGLALDYPFFQKMAEDYHLTGRVVLESTVPLKTGLGASAMLCLCWARLLAHLGRISPTEIFETAHQLENFFHGQSSGVDIAGVASDTCIVFQKGKPIHPIEVAWAPSLYLVRTATDGVTKEAVGKVNALQQNEARHAQSIDTHMQHATDLIKSALEQPGPAALQKMAEGIRMAESCFDEWGLILPQMRELASQLKKMGALATKPTGSGLGGYILSLWPAKLPTDFPLEAIPVEVSPCV